LRQRWRLYAALASSWILLVALMSAGPRSSSTGFSTSVSSWTYLLNQSRLIVRYLRLAFWPAGLVIDYGVPLPLSFGQVWPYMAVLTLLFAATVIAFVRWPRIGFLGAWFFITLGPTSSVMPIATWVGAERRMYLPLVAIAALVLFALQKASKGVMRKGYDPLFIGAVAALVVACGMTTAARNRKYQSPEQLARSSVEHWPSGRARHWLGLELLAEGRRGEATEELNRAVADDPRTHYTLGVMAFQDRRFDAAIQELEAFARDEPMRAEVPAARQMIGRAMAEEGRLPDAERELRAALKMSPDDADMHAYLGDVLLKEQRFREAAAEYQQLLDRKPPTSGTLTNLGIALMADGKADAATKAFQRATELDPSDGVARRNLVQALVDQRRFADALPQAETAVGLRPDDAASHDNLGIALAATHQLDRAIAEFRRALTLNPDDGDIRGHLAAAERLKSAAE
jgi:Flp pilus assembly protein TadD